METEKLKIFHDSGYLGTATREEVHRIGHWHETFHCWFVKKSNKKNYILFQLRSSEKKDFPDLLDITSAGHLLHDEEVADGVREIKEEIGVDLVIDDLISIGIIKDEIITKDIIDKEVAHVFVHLFNQPISNLKLQKEEVSGIVQIDFESFYDLWINGREHIEVEALELNVKHEVITSNKVLKKAMFLPHSHSYYSCVLERIKALLDRKTNMIN
jgi:isopentenyldiphosphate isomerase